MSWEYWKSQVNEDSMDRNYSCPNCGKTLSWIFLETMASKGSGRAREEIQK